MLLKDRVAIVTGAGRGVGRAVALDFAREGAKVVVNDPGVGLQGGTTDERLADEVVREIRAASGTAIANYESVADFASAEKIVRGAVEAFGALDILVNNAGIIRDSTLLKMTEEDFDAVIAVHLKGTFNTCRHAAPVMREQGYGRIVNMTSAAGLKGNFGQTNYSAAKAGIIGLTMTLALELGKYGITVNAFAPRATTRMTSAIPSSHDPVKSRGEETAPEHNAPFVSFLASEAAAGISGQIFGKGAPAPSRYGFLIFGYSRGLAEMVRERPWTAADVAEAFGETLAPHLQERNPKT